MKLTVLLLVVSIFSVNANGYGQKTKVTIDLDHVEMREVLETIESLTDFKFLYNNKKIDAEKLVSVSAKNKPVSEVLDELFKGTPIYYVLRKKQIILKTKSSALHSILLKESPLLKDDGIIQRTVSGTVTDGQGVPLSGANIVEKGTNKGVIADFDGNFSLNIADDNAILVVSYIGFATKEVAVNGAITINVTLAESTAVLDEIVVIGYGTQKKSDLTGSVSSLKPDDLNPGANASVDQMMLGRAAGVQINQVSSAPGGGLSIRIRGASSLNASNEPLYVIDGFPIDNSPNQSSGSAADLANNQSPNNPLNSLNPADIESIEILKDASATAIYGSRGANGVVMITTKKGRVGKMTVTYDVYGGMQTVAKTIDVLSPSQYISTINDLSVEQGNTIVFSDEDIARIGNGNSWQDLVFRSAPITNHNLSVGGGTENTSIYASFNYLDQEGVVVNSGMKRYTGRVNIDTKIGERANIGVNFNTSLIKDNNNIDGINTNEQGGPIYSSLLYDPTEPIYNSDGSFAQSANLTVNNPVTLVNAISSLNETNRTFGNVYLNYNFTDNLSGRFNFGTDRQISRRDIYNSTKTILGRAAGGIADINVLERSNYLFEYTMNYNKAFNENHNLAVLGGVTYQKFDSRSFSGDISGFPTDNIVTNNLALGNTNNDQLGSRKEENTLLSYLGRINYTFFNKFLLTGSFRADGSSRFGENNKFGYFPSAAFGWKLSEEEFIPDAFNELKLRASWGKTGNQEIGNYNSLVTLIAGPNVVLDHIVQGSVIPSRIGNPELKWENTEQFNIGLDAALSNGRISVTLDYFSKKTKDLLFALPLPLASGYSSILSNIGSVENKGFEGLLNTTNIVNDDFKWETSLIFSAIKNNVLDLGRIESIVTGNIQSVGNTAIIKRGDPLASYYGYKVTGIFQEGDDIVSSAQPTAQPGFPIFEDLNGDGAITPSDQTIIGSPFPDFTYGIQNSFSYKDLKLDIFFQGQQGGELININLIESLYPNNFRRNRQSKTILDRWTPQNTDAKWPSSVNPSAYGASKVNTLTVEDASYLRLKNVQLSYNLPVDKINFLNSIKVYITGQNLFTITDYGGFDPESNSLGSSNVRLDFSSYPLARTYLLGLSANF